MSDNKTTRYTKPQQNVIDYRGKNILVSASAGTGKTTVMIERIASLIEEGTDVSQIVVVTFTNLAAAEMKNRLAVKLSQKTDDPRVFERLEKLDTASICTLHAFCSELLRNYFYVADIDPSFTILDEATVSTLKSNALDEVFEFYFSQNDPLFFKTYKIFSTARKEENFRNTLLNLYDFSRCIVDFPDWYSAKRQNFLKYGDDNPLVKTILNDISQTVTYYKNNYISLAERCSDEGLPFENVVRYNAELLEGINVGNLSDALNDVSKISLQPLPRRNSKNCSDVEDKIREDFKSLSSEIKKIVGNYSAICRGEKLETLWNETAKSVEITDKLVEAVCKFDETYFEMKKQRGGLDFNDLEHLTLKVLESPEALEQIKEKYSYVFVDEYQDTNPVQEAIISALGKDCNLFMVGDVKQSIYGFRGCEPDIFVDKYRSYKNDKTGYVEELNDNFRSNARILNFVNALFKGIMTADFGKVDYARSSMLCGIKPPALNVASVKIDLITREEKQDETLSGVYDITQIPERENGVEQGELIARRIKQYVGLKYKDADGEIKTITYGDIVILMRSLTDKAENIYARLVENGIPVAAGFKSDDLSSKEIKDFVNLLRVLDNPYNDVYVVGVCLSPFGKFTESELGIIRLDTQGRIPFYSRLVNYAKQDGDIRIKNKIDSLLEFLDKIRFYSRCASVSDVALRVIKESSYDLFVEGLPNGGMRMRKLYAFIDKLKDAEYARSVEKFLSYLDESHDNRADESQGETDAVRLMTMHASKGLEFSIVIVAGLETNFRFDYSAVETNAEMGVAVKHYDFEKMKVANTLGAVACGMFNKTKQREEEMRLLYVATTRAKFALNLVGSLTRKQLEALPKLPARAISHLDWLLYAIRNELNDEAFLSENSVELNVIEELPTENDSSNNGLLCKQRTDLNAELKKINYRYPYESQIEMPSKIVSSALDKEYIEGTEESTFTPALNDNADRNRIGTAYHKILQYVSPESTQEQIEEIVRGLIAEGKIEKRFEEKIDASKIYAVLRNAEFKRLLVSGKIYREIPFMLLSPYNDVAKDARFTDEVMLQGVIDLLIIDGDRAVVVDYKYTSHSDTARDKYEMQLKSYKTAVQKICGIDNVECYVLSIDDNKLIKM